MHVLPNPVAILLTVYFVLGAQVVIKEMMVSSQSEIVARRSVHCNVMAGSMLLNLGLDNRYITLQLEEGSKSSQRQ